MSEPLRELEAELAELEQRGLRRREPWSSGRLRGINLCSNDYLGLARTTILDASRHGGSGASPLVTGYDESHLSAEEALSAWLQVEGVALFASGYAANVGTIPALVGAGDVVVSDRLNHASIIDGCRLSGARVLVVDHLRCDQVDEALAKARPARRRLVVTESYFSMDGDSPDLVALREICSRREALLMVDEAHAIGWGGPEGRGLCAAAGVEPDVLVGTLGKSIGLHGAFVAGRAVLKSWLWNRARSLVFSTALSPVIAGEVPRRVAFIRGREGDGARGDLSRAAASLRAALGVSGSGPVIPWVVGGSQEAVDVAEALHRRGVLVSAIRPPTVPDGSARLRFTASAALGQTDLAIVLPALAWLASTFHVKR